MIHFSGFIRSSLESCRVHFGVQQSLVGVFFFFFLAPFPKNSQPPKLAVAAVRQHDVSAVTTKRKKAVIFLLNLSKRNITFGLNAAATVLGLQNTVALKV